MRYSTVYQRLVANTEEPANEQSCWCWSRRGDKAGYGRIELWVKGLQRTVSLYASVVMWIIVNTEARTWDEVYLAALELRHSGLEVDHLCHTPPCVNPDHLDLKTPKENAQARRQDRWRDIDRPPEKTACPWCDVEDYAWNLCGAHADTYSCVRLG